MGEGGGGDLGFKTHLKRVPPTCLECLLPLQSRHLLLQSSGSAASRSGAAGPSTV